MVDLKETAGKIGTGIKEAGAKAASWEKEHFPGQVEAVKGVGRGIADIPRKLEEAHTVAQAKELQRLRNERLKLEGRVNIQQLKQRESTLIAQSKKQLGVSEKKFSVFNPPNVWGRSVTTKTTPVATGVVKQPLRNVWTGKVIRK